MHLTTHFLLLLPLVAPLQRVSWLAVQLVQLLLSEQWRLELRWWGQQMLLLHWALVALQLLPRLVVTVQ